MLKEFVTYWGNGRCTNAPNGPKHATTHWYSATDVTRLTNGQVKQSLTHLDIRNIRAVPRKNEMIFKEKSTKQVQPNTGTGTDEQKGR